MESSWVERRRVIPELLHCLAGLPAAPVVLGDFPAPCVLPYIGMCQGDAVCPESVSWRADPKDGAERSVEATKSSTHLASLAEEDKAWVPLPPWSITGCDPARELPSVRVQAAKILISPFPPAVTRSCSPCLPKI